MLQKAFQQKGAFAVSNVDCMVMSAAERFNAFLDMSLDVPGQTLHLGRVPVTGVAGTARLHTNKEVCAKTRCFVVLSADDDWNILTINQPEVNG